MANSKTAERETLKARADGEELAERLVRAVPQDGSTSPMRALHLQRCSSPTAVNTVYGPALCVIAQGAKEVLVGDDRHRHDSSRYLLITVGVPVVSRVLEASRERPYLSLHLDLDMALVRSVATEAELVPLRETTPVRALSEGAVDAGLLDATLRLARLLDTPSEAKVLAPLVTREIVYRLLLGERGGQLRRMADQGGELHHVARAAEELGRNLAQPSRVEDVARRLGMSVSSFHAHFKAAVGLSPLQFQKRMRLQEARRLMLDEALDAAEAGYRVGYDDAAHFSREYRSLFSLPPKRDVERLRGAARTLD